MFGGSFACPTILRWWVVKRLSAVVAGLVLVASCSGGGSTPGFWARYLEFVDDLSAGRIATFAEFQTRISLDALGDPEGPLGLAHKRLLMYVAAGDEDAAVSTTFQIEKACLDLLDLFQD